ncbi:hypothetical protein HPB47_023630 [Ixodes persulcatus]|uniref:Uncharacterized protein n=1 Tax=Ixodes persulcatus TaxID=34615 RepID=A0AC60Q9H2_IXOPE|nr:hypothetical protein HPB47_023630 [Ixodes persulcatus]
MKIPERVENGLDMDPDGQVAVEGAVRTVAFCPCKWNSSLLAVGSSDRVTVFSLKFPASVWGDLRRALRSNAIMASRDCNIVQSGQRVRGRPMEVCDEFPYLVQDEGSDQGELAVEVVRRFAHKEPVCSVAWSPNMSLVLSPVCMRFATASSDGKVRIFCSNLQEKDDISVLDGHRGPVNAVAWEPHSGEAVASVGDDNTCRVWGLDGEQRACLVLRSPGTAVAWHPDEAGKLLVAEKRGTLRLYNALSWQPLMSLDTGPQGAPLLSADWSVCNSLLLGAVAGPSWFLWETARSSRPLEQKVAHPGGGTDFRFSHVHEALCATRGFPGNQVRVLNLRTAQEPREGQAEALSKADKAHMESLKVKRMAKGHKPNMTQDYCPRLL